MDRKLTIALAGNPNSGKTTLFNSLTGARQHVGNYPGVTVEKKEGFLQQSGYDLTIVDLPGIYGLTARSLDEIISRDYIVNEKPDVVICVVDSSNLERNLYLAVQLIELEVPLVLAFNMHDQAVKQGDDIDRNMISQLLGVPVVFTVAVKRQGVKELLDEAVKIAEEGISLKKQTVDYGRDIEEEILKIEEIVKKDNELTEKYPARWLAVKMLEEDSEILKISEKSRLSSELFARLGKSRQHLQTVFGDTPDAEIAGSRYGFIHGACSEAVKKDLETRYSLSDKIDMVLLNRVFGLPIFFLLMWLVFKFTFTLSEPLMGLIEGAQEWLGNIAGGLIEAEMFNSLVVDGIIAGVGSVLVFVPIIFLLFLAIAFLEDSGYIARAAFLMDKFMHKIGLHGRSFIPLLLGFGCSVPAIMACRTIDDRKDRFVTMLVTPFISCGAKLPVYALFIAAFFSEKSGANVLFSIYILGILIAVAAAKIFRKHLFRGPASPFVMELPPYRIPALKGLLIHMWERGFLYLKKAGTIIFAGCVIIWFLSNFPFQVAYSKDYDLLIEQAGDNSELVSELSNQMASEKLEKSFAGKIGKTTSVFFTPLGFEDWRIGVSLIGGFVAKEIVVGVLGTLYSLGEVDEETDSLREALRNATREDGTKTYTPLVALSFMVFVLLYIPCIATVAVVKRETNSWKWPVFLVLFTTSVAWTASFIIYQGGTLMGF